MLKKLKSSHLGAIALVLLVFCVFVSIKVYHIYNPGKKPLSLKPADNPILTEYTGPVEHIFFHSLIVYPEIAFHAPEAKGLNDYYVTTVEFGRILEALYQRGYILVSPLQVYETYQEGDRAKIRRRKLMLPAGKKPIIISFDDTNYYHKFNFSGINARLILTNGRLATLAYDKKGQLQLSYNSEHITLINEFVARHPDFSYDNARGVIGVTGYEGILGYRLSDNYPQHEAEKEKAIQVVTALTNQGWIFASHSYTHWHLEQIPLERLKYDFTRWNQNIRPVVGDIPVYLYPFGEGPLDNNNPRAALFLSNGFHILCSVEPQTWEKVYPEDNLVITSRRQIDGIALRYYAELNRDLYDPELVIDFQARKPFANLFAQLARLTNKSVLPKQPEVVSAHTNTYKQDL